MDRRAYQIMLTAAPFLSGLEAGSSQRISRPGETTVVFPNLISVRFGKVEYLTAQPTPLATTRIQ